MTLLQSLILVAAGAAAGFINALAGGGSAITIPILTEMVGINTANGTNRIAIFLANLTAIAGYQKGEAVPWRRLGVLVIPTVTGAAAGAWLSTVTPPDLLRMVFAGVLLLVATSVLLRPSRWLEDRDAALREPWRSLVFLGIGFYGGFVQAGVGFVLLGGLVLGAGMNLVKGNAAKVVLIAAYSPIAIVLFANAAQIDVAAGAVLAAGQMSGAWAGSRLAVLKGAAWIRWILVVAAVAAAARLVFAQTGA
ncbi:MAG: sulfite exporter TauE/SafE family protein [Actinomycetota bacterium]|nr:sulfite exporter TauE/SafE family protein [Actinomycetota bacterium]